jgi:acyl carrier protein
MNNKDFIKFPAQTNLDLYQQMFDNNYSGDEICLVNSAYLFTLGKVFSLVRGSGKPFICHLIGTASLLIEAKAPVDIVLAGLMHANYQNRVPFDNYLAIPKRREIVESMFGSKIDSIIFDYTTLQDLAISEIKLDDSEIGKAKLLIYMADNLEDLVGNSLFMHGGLRFEENQKGGYLSRKEKYLNTKEYRVKLLDFLGIIHWNDAYDFWLKDEINLHFPSKLKTGFLSSVNILILNMESKFYNILSEALMQDISLVNDNENLFNIEGWDSLTHIRIITELESNFDRKLTDEQMIEINTLGALKAAFCKELE